MRAVRVMVALGGLLAGGCADESWQVEADREAAALLAEVQAADYRSWAPMPGFAGAQPSRSPHGNAVEVFVNRVLADAIEAGPPWPDGSVVVKDGYDGDRQIGRAIMRKSGGAWFFSNFTADDRLIAASDGPGCVDCHGAGRDQLLSAPMTP